MKQESHSKPSGKTLAWVAGAHVLVLILAFVIPSILKPSPPDKFIQMVPLGSIDPGEGKPDSADQDSGGSMGSKGGGIQGKETLKPPTQPKAQTATPDPVVLPAQVILPKPVAPVVPAKPIVVKETVVPVKSEKIKPVTKPEPIPEKPKVTEPVAKPKSKITPNLTVVKKEGTATAKVSGTSKPSANTSNNTGQGLSASDVETKLRGKFGTGSGDGTGAGQGNAGVEGGTGQGRLGDPNGVANAPWYDIYIGNQLKKNWVRPASGPSIEAWVAVRIYADGTVHYVRLTKTSGNPEMDQSVINAVQSVQKLGTLPPKGLPNPYDRVVKFEL